MDSSELSVAAAQNRLQAIQNQNTILKISLQHERKNRNDLEFRNRELNEKLKETGGGLRDTKEALLQIQKATNEMIIKRDAREEVLQKSINLNQVYEEKFGPIYLTAEDELKAKKEEEAIRQQQEEEKRLKEAQWNALNERIAALQQELRDAADIHEEQLFASAEELRDSQDKVRYAGTCCFVLPIPFLPDGTDGAPSPFLGPCRADL